MAGIYQFQIYLHTGSQKWSILLIKKGSTTLCAAIGDGTNTGGDAPSGTCLTNVQLTVGETVYVYKAGGEDNGLRVDYLLNGFSGHLLTTI